MRPHAQTEEARIKDLHVFVRALGRAESAPRRNPELVKAIRKVIRLYTAPLKSRSPGREPKVADAALVP